MKCILCNKSTELLHTKQDAARGELQYFFCSTENGCDLIFLDPAKRIDAAEEQARYETHNNNAADDGYKNFLHRLADPVISLATAKAALSEIQALDFGCGPTTVMADIFAEQGIGMQSYDPFFYADTELLQQQYDVITASEVIEHVYDPAAVFTQLTNMLKPGGYFGVMTETVTDPEKFATWWYHRDKTHVCFYSEKTLHWFADANNVEIVHFDNSVCVFQT